MIRKKMIDVKVFTIDGREEKVRIFSILGTDLYYVSGKAFDAKYDKYCGGVHFAVPYRWTVDDDGKYHPITDLPDYVRKVYRMDDGQITDMLYDNTYQDENGRKENKKMLDRDKIIATINLFQTILEYQGEIAYLNSELEKRTEDTVRNAIKARLIWLYETMPKLEVEVIVLAYMWIKYFEERNTSKKNEESD